MSDVYIIGAHSTRFGKRPENSFRDLARETYLGVLDDAGLENGDDIGFVWFGNCGMGSFGQPCIRGQVTFTPLVEEGLFPERVPMINVEGGCATASMALNGAFKDVASGSVDVALAIGVEKTYAPNDAALTQSIFDGGIDQLNPEEWHTYYARAAEATGTSFDPKSAGGTVFMDTYAMQAKWHMQAHGTTQAQIAAGASKNHWHGSMNPNAQYQFEVSVEDVLADRVISDPLTRAMCAPIGDGAASALVVSGEYLAAQPKDVQARAVKIRASQLSGGKYRAFDEPGLSRFAAQAAYKQAGITPGDIDVAEVHDATSFCEIYQCEMMGFCEDGTGGAYVESGATRLGGALPVNLSGGLVSKGHPVGATGLSMIQELCLQLRGEAGVRQAEGARFALAENGGGVIGFDEAACAVTILEAPV